MSPAQAFLDELLKKFHSEKSDAELARLTNFSEEHVAATRTTLGLPTPTVALTMKEAARQYLMALSPQEKKEFLSSIPKKDLWEMAEGKAATSGTLDVTTEPIRIDISHQLRKIYGPPDGTVLTEVLDTGEDSRLPAGSGG